MDTYLFRVSLTATSVWSKYYAKHVRPIYVVARDAEDARQKVLSQLVPDVTVKSVAKLGAQLSVIMFR